MATGVGFSFGGAKVGDALAFVGMFSDADMHAVLRLLCFPQLVLLACQHDPHDPQRT